MIQQRKGCRLASQFYFMYKAGNERNPQSTGNKFLERFEGRTSTIGKAGLLSLLQQNRTPQSPGLVSERSKQNENMYEGIKKIQRPQETQRMGMGAQLSFGNSSRYSQEERDRRASHLSFRSDMPTRKSSLEQVGNSSTRNSVPKLPQIGRESRMGMGFQMRSSVELKAESKQNLIKNKDSAQHLQFLNMFQQRLKRAGQK